MPLFPSHSQDGRQSSVDGLHEHTRRHPRDADGWYDLAIALQDRPGARTPAERRFIIDALARFLDLAKRTDRRRPDAMARFTEQVRSEARERVDRGDMNVPAS